MIICILGRQPELGRAELAALYGSVRMFGSDTALIDATDFDIQTVGGSQKAGKVVHQLSHTNWPAITRTIIDYYSDLWRDNEHKITLGISVYGNDSLRPNDINKLGLTLKQRVKKSGGSLRLVPNKSTALNTAVSHHNKLGLSPHKVELIIVQSGGQTIIAESVGAQNITALAKRDQGRPKRDAFVGMLPPKLALMMLNMALGHTSGRKHVLDPFCGTGVVLQEAFLLGHTAYGSDLSEKMVDFSTQNLAWLEKTHRASGSVASIVQADATNFSWPEASQLDAVVCETYLGQPFSATPSPTKLREVRGNCNHIIGQFLQNIGSQINPGTSLCVAVPAWRDLKSGKITRLPLIEHIDDFGFEQQNTRSLLYFREDQVVARDILVLRKC